jgi:hypothetical protein
MAPDPTTVKERLSRSDNFYDDDILAKHPENVVDHRPSGGPLLSLLRSEEKMYGQTLFLA